MDPKGSKQLEISSTPMNFSYSHIYFPERGLQSGIF